MLRAISNEQQAKNPQPVTRNPQPATHFSDFQKLGVEVSIETPWDDIWIVPEYTKKARLEFTPKDIAMLKEVREIFGGKVVEVRSLPGPSKRKEPGKTKIPFRRPVK